MALTDKLSAIGDAIRAKTGKNELLTLDDMPTEIESIETGGGGGDLPEEAFVISGNCYYRFAYGGWDWFIDGYGNKINTSNITDAQYMFSQTTVEHIPFELNFSADVASGISLKYMFSEAKNLKELPKINNCKASELASIFYNCHSLRCIPEDIVDWFDWSLIEGATSANKGATNGMFYYCHSLRSIPTNFLSRVNPNAIGNYTYFYSGFAHCYALDELTDLPIPYTSTWTSNAFLNAFTSCHRLKNLTFATLDGQPYAVKWRNQTIDLSSTVGRATNRTNITSYNSGLTTDTEIKYSYGESNYHELKDNPDSWTLLDAFSRYNHDSAVATINSLPDTSAYLATAGGTNTIKFKGIAGSDTDGGAINTLTAEEIAVATAKGWTVTLA